MPVRPQARTHTTDLPEYQPVLLRLDHAEEVKANDPADPEKTNVVLTFTVMSPPWGQQDPPAKQRQQHSNTVNPRGGGKPSYMATLINALHDHDLTKEEQLLVDLEQHYGQIVEAIGTVTTNDRGKWWNVETYRRPTAAAPTTADGTYQYTPDGRHRWKEGMTAWEPVPQAAPPPPPPPTAPPPPPPAPPAPAASAPAAGGPPPPPPEIKF